MYFKNKNIIIGLLKYFIKKNNLHDKEGFKEFNKYYFVVELDVSGFEEGLIMKGIEELMINPKWIIIGKSHILFREINNPEYNITNQILKFHILKTKLIEFRDLALKDK
ncbi:MULTISPECIES: hypothetical protein [Leeuwenhoekiella]|uniref:Uncharacterized protein n=2 Tax=Flavobacteriia TaxID=117743 RepID=A0A4Q0PBU4_9FLAO|nr:hypothetical protein [Leeuwenhoekiella aequorea]AOE06015.1 hypothetical protein [uncultured bacterium]RXG24300.1 hypothetical protein DSM00_86 [Leeuwenhoekiella aequorea]CCF99590.1 hypothetical protein VIS_S18BNA50021 [uncultured Flavobacteriia bacterium]